ncbi:MAG: type II toxin-antitoxin system VapC family toxin [Blastocatellia bacterium]
MAHQSYLLDTNILVHLVREDAIGQRLGDEYSLLLIQPPPMISDVTEGELRSLAIQWKWGERKRDQMEYLLSYFWRIAINDPDIFDAYAAIDSHSESVGQPMGKNDVWIAASAQAMKACLLTTDKDFDHLQTLFITREWIDPERDKKS